MEVDQYVLGAIYASLVSGSIVQVVEITQEYGDYTVSTNRLSHHDNGRAKWYEWRKDFLIDVRRFREATKEEEQIYYEAQLWRANFDRDYLDVQIGDLIKDVETNLLEEVTDVSMAIEGIKCGMLKMYKADDVWEKNKTGDYDFFGYDDIAIVSHFDQRLTSTTIAPKMKYPTETNAEFDCKIPIRF